MEGSCNMEMNYTEIYVYLQETASLSFTEIYKLLEIVLQKFSRFSTCTSWHYFIDFFSFKGLLDSKLLLVFMIIFNI